jgi:hypothetical protein
MARPRLPFLPRRPEVPWPAIIEALRAGGISTRRIGDAIALSHSTIQGWKRGAKPNFEDGQALLALAWRERDLLPSELVMHCEPRNVDLPARFRGEPVDEPRRSVAGERRHVPTPHAEPKPAVDLPVESPPWVALDSLALLWRSTCATPA